MERVFDIHLEMKETCCVFYTWSIRQKERLSIRFRTCTFCLQWFSGWKIWWTQRKFRLKVACSAVHVLWYIATESSVNYELYTKCIFCIFCCSVPTNMSMCHQSFERSESTTVPSMLDNSECGRVSQSKTVVVQVQELGVLVVLFLWCTADSLSTIWNL